MMVAVLRGRERRCEKGDGEVAEYNGWIPISHEYGLYWSTSIPGTSR